MNALMLLSQMPQNVGSGVITGGWGYVLAAYLVFWVGLALYSASLIIRTRAAKREEEQQ